MSTGIFHLQNRGETDIFGAYYDEGRITRELDPDPVWSALDNKLFAGYQQISDQTGNFAAKKKKPLEKQKPHEICHFETASVVFFPRHSNSNAPGCLT